MVASPQPVEAAKQQQSFIRCFPLCWLYQMAELGVFLPGLVGLYQDLGPLWQPLWPDLNTCGSLCSRASFLLARRGLPPL